MVKGLLHVAAVVSSNPSSPDDTERSLVWFTRLEMNKVVKEGRVLLPDEGRPLVPLQDGVLLRGLEEGHQSVLQHDVGLPRCVV